MESTAVQHDASLPTGRVNVALDEHGSPSYEIEHPSAWDAFDANDAHWQSLARRCHVVCFGSLAQRDPRSRMAIQQFVTSARQAVRLFDVNLRQHFHNADLICQSLGLATMLKTNEDEAPIISQYTGVAPLRSATRADALPWAVQLMERFSLDAVILTRGARGTLLCTRAGAFESDGEAERTMHRFPPSTQADSVGAGDACAAGLLVGWLAQLPPAQIVSLCDRMGAYVAGRPGATPPLPDALLA
jgi:fructokinase